MDTETGVTAETPRLFFPADNQPSLAAGEAAERGHVPELPVAGNQLIAPTVMPAETEALQDLKDHRPAVAAEPEA